MMVILNRMITEVLPASSARHKSTYRLVLLSKYSHQVVSSV